MFSGIVEEMGAVARFDGARLEIRARKALEDLRVSESIAVAGVCLTVVARHEGGFAVDDIEIAEIGYRDDAEADRGWDAKGFIRSTNTIRERYIVQVLHFGTTPRVERYMVEGGSVDLDVDTSGDRAAPLLAVTPLAVRTTEVTPFEIKVTAKR